MLDSMPTQNKKSENIEQSKLNNAYQTIRVGKLGDKLNKAINATLAINIIYLLTLYINEMSQNNKADNRLIKSLQNEEISDDEKCALMKEKRTYLTISRTCYIKIKSPSGGLI